MSQIRVGDPPDPVAEIIASASVLDVELDEHEAEHLAFVRHHPRFADALKALREDLDCADPDWPRSLVRAAVADPGNTALPARRFAEAWAISPAMALLLAAGPHEIEIPGEASGVSVQETPTEFIVRIPRPVTPARRAVLKDWLGSEIAEGAIEGAWEKAGKSRFDTSPKVASAIPWFVRWNQDVEPAAIWRDVTADRPDVIDFDTFHRRLVRVWERMLAISPDGVRPDRPSKEPA